jgi:hypothetical protein
VVRSVAGTLWARRPLLVAGAAILVVMLLLGLTNGGDGDPATSVSSTVPVTAAPTTTVAPTTTTPPEAKTPPPKKGPGEGKGKGKKGGG